MDQNTKDWLKWRQSGLGSSDLPVIMGVSPWMTPKQLWEEKTGKKKHDQSNWAIDRGNRWEPAARARFELQNDLEFPPQIFVHPEYDFLRASCDGANVETKSLLEIKIPGKEAFQKAKGGDVPDYYLPQLEHQLLVSGYERVYFYCCEISRDTHGIERISDDVLIVYEGNQKYRDILLDKACKFWELVKKKIEPELTDADVLILGDEWFDEIAELKEAKGTKKFKSLKLQLIKKLPHTRCECGGVSISKGKRGWTVRMV